MTTKVIAYTTVIGIGHTAAPVIISIITPGTTPAMPAGVAPSITTG